MIRNVSLQRRVTGPAEAELRVLVELEDGWHVIIHERCVGNLNITKPMENVK